MKSFDLEEERLRQEITRLGVGRVLIQLPEGLKPEAPRLAKMVEKLGVIAIVSADPCYGACDLATAEAESLGVDMIIHYGHSRLLKNERIPTLYVEARATVRVEDVVQKTLSMLKNWRRIGLATTVQHVQALDLARECLLRNGKTVEIGDTGHLSYPGQVIGCDYSNARSIAKDVDAFLFIGGGRFHALGVALSTRKPTVVADPFEGRAYSVDQEAERVLKQRWASIKKAEEAKNFGVLIGVKPGQEKLEEALTIKRKLDENGKAAWLFAASEVTPEALMGFPTVDAYVNTACPRVSLDDAARFSKPVLTADEALVMVGELSWEELSRKGLFEN